LGGVILVISRGWAGCLPKEKLKEEMVCGLLDKGLKVG
jgi:hypothetical protein